MSDRIAFSVGGVPVGKGRPRTTARVVYQGGKAVAIVTVHTPPETRKAEKAVQAAARSALIGRKPWTCPLRLTVVAIFEPPPSWPKAVREAAERGEVYHTSVPDSDNLAKLITDALNGLAFADDAQVAESYVRKRYGRPARTDVELRPIISPTPGATPPPSPAERARVKKAGDGAASGDPNRVLDASPRFAL